MLSSLCSIVNLSPNCSKPRNEKLSRLTYHHMAGKLTAKSCLDMFASTTRQASANYVIGYNGEIGGCVDENNRAWTSGSRDNDNRAITFELSNSAVGGNWPVSDATIQAAIDLTVDICKRNGKTTVLWFGDKDKSLSYKPADTELVITLHKWFQNTDCPGAYLESKLSYIASETNKRLTKEAYVAEKWYEKSGEWVEAKKLGITDGTNPDKAATRAEVAAMIVRGLKLVMKDE